MLGYPNKVEAVLRPSATGRGGSEGVAGECGLSRLRLFFIPNQGVGMYRKKKRYFAGKVEVQFENPAQSANFAVPGIQALSSVAPGYRAIVRDLSGGSHLWAKLEGLGLLPGVEVTVLVNSGHGPLKVGVDDSRVLLGRRMAGAVLVKAVAADREMS